jgi:uncharacterized protein (TIGR01319 family)
MNYYLLIDFGSTNTKLTVVDIDNKCLVGTAKAITTVNTDINIGYEKALIILFDKYGEMKFTKTIACSSASGGLKMAAIGLVEELTVEAAKRVCFGAGGKVDLVLSHFITTRDVKDIIDKKIDIVLLAGGTDGGNHDCVIHNAKMLGKGGITTPIIYAGNKSCQDEISEIFEEYHLHGYICSNVMPRLNVLNIEPARDIIRKIFMENIIYAKGVKKIQAEIESIILPTPHAVIMGAEILSKGYLHETGLGEIILVDIGGATTDIYSMSSGNPKRADVILKGLEEPYSKRTVEGDLGMRYSAEGVINSLSTEQKKIYLEKGIDIEKEGRLRMENIEMIPTNEDEEKVETEFGKICADVAFGRHVGRMESVYSPLGMMYYQFGKDLSEVEAVIGTGGVIIYGKEARQILEEVCVDPKRPLELRPKNPKFMIDKEYILSAMGLLSMYEPEVALKIMKDNIKII